MEVLTGIGAGTHRKRATRPSTVMQTLRMTSEKAPEARIPASHVGILETALLAIVSTISHRDGMISSNPVGFDWDGEHVRLSTLKSRVKYHNLQANPQITLCVVDPKVPTRYLEIRGFAELVDDPESTLSRKLFAQMSGTEMPPDLDPPGDERAIIKIVPLRVSAPDLYGGRLDRRAEQAEQKPPSRIT
jgi:PPOX class probable F420-dependent enzyme